MLVGWIVMTMTFVSGCGGNGSDKRPAGDGKGGGAAIEVPVFGQRWEPWQSDPLGSSASDTIGSHGCAIASVAMIMSKNGADVDPRKLNEWLKANGGYVDEDVLIWSATDSYPGGVTFAGRVDWQNEPADLAQVDAELDAGYPVVAETRINGSLHFVVLKGHEGTTYFMNDPWNGSGDVTFNTGFGEPARMIYGIRKYRPQAQ
jgi:hypothetical protein